MNQTTDTRTDYADLTARSRLTLALQMKHEDLMQEYQALCATCPAADKEAFEAGILYARELVFCMGWRVEMELRGMAEFACAGAPIIGLLRYARSGNEHLQSKPALVLQIERAAEQMAVHLRRLKALQQVARDRADALGVTVEDLFFLPATSTEGYDLLKLMDGSPAVVKILESIEKAIGKTYSREPDVEFGRTVLDQLTNL